MKCLKFVAYFPSFSYPDNIRFVWLFYHDIFSCGIEYMVFCKISLAFVEFIDTHSYKFKSIGLKKILHEGSCAIRIDFGIMGMISYFYGDFYHETRLYDKFQIFNFDFPLIDFLVIVSTFYSLLYFFISFQINFIFEKDRSWMDDAGVYDSFLYS
jgi:hypothetical protein